ncbi:MAG: DUF6351 family protein [Vicinamibacterales bacterium]
MSLFATSGCRTFAPRSLRGVARPALCGGAALAAVLIPAFVAAQSPSLRVLSTRPEMVSGGDVLLAVVPPADAAVGDVRVRVNGAESPARFTMDGQGRGVGLVTGLKNGTNAIEAVGKGGIFSRVSVVNHPITGPVFAGPQEQPFVCGTDRFKLPGGATLGAPLDAHCSIATRVDYAYRPASGGDLKPFDPNAPAGDVATVTLGGRTMPYVVRIETGTVNRAIYQIAMLHDPSTPAPSYSTRSAGWNGRLIYTFGGGCEPGWYQQGTGTGGVTDDVHLRRGYAVASASLNVAGNNCNDLISAETMMMVKERFIESYGLPLFTIGWGSSGGSIQQHHIAQNYPGLLDGLMTGRSFADVAFASSTSSGEARILETYFKKTAVAFTDEQKRAVTGFGNLATMTNLSRVRAPRFNATERCPEGLTAEQKYDAVKNPKGARCTIWDHGVNTYGKDPATGFARRPLDNVGIQYGLSALNAGVLTKEQFLDLNEKVGGFDIDGNVTSVRMVGDASAIRAAYRTGRLTSGAGGLGSVPIIDYRTYYDDLPQGDVHLRFHSFSTRLRLARANGYSDNQVMLVQDRRYGDFDTTSPVLTHALEQMDQWLTAYIADTAKGTLIEKLRRAKPADLVDACWTKDETPQKIVEQQQYQAGRCNDLYPSHSYPRGVAGAPLSNDIIKCQLKPVSAADYKMTFSPEELTRLKMIFPQGVCDWSKPGAEQQPLAGTWQTFGSMMVGTGASR